MRLDEKLAKNKERLALLEPGGAPERPIEVVSASLVEVHAKSIACLACGSESRIESHEAKAFGGGLLRVVAMKCPFCGRGRTLYFRIMPTFAN